MPGRVHSRSIARIVLAALVATTLLAGRVALPGGEVSALSRWTGGIDLYRTGVFTTQKTWLWCTAADVQIIRNIADHQTDHSRTNQRRYFDYMRAHNRYAIPVTDGTDPAGWTAGLRHFVDSRYRLYQNTSFSSALRSAVTNMRKTNLPVAITVQHGNHGWVMTGFTATADPARTTRFTVTSVRVVGPLWGLRNRTYGYDMRPNTKLTPTQLRGFFTPWHYARVKMAWEGKWVSIQPVATTTSTATTAVTPSVAVVAAPPAPIGDQKAVVTATESRVAPTRDSTAGSITGWSLSEAAVPPAAAVAAPPERPATAANPGATAPVARSAVGGVPEPAIVPVGLACLIVLVAAVGGLARRHRPAGTVAR
jgi:hypothetical protein